MSNSQRKHNKPGALLQRKGRRAGLSCLLALFLASCTTGARAPVPPPPPGPPPIPAAYRGGSNLLSFTAGGSGGFIAQFDTSTVIITTQLQQMFANGQRRLKIPILFYHGAMDGIAVDSTGGGLSQRMSDNLLHLLQLARSIGFEQAEVEFLPEWWNDPEWWVNPGPNTGSSYATNCLSRVVGQDGIVLDELTNNWYQENWSFIANTHTVFLASGMPYVVDVMGEAVDPRFFSFAQRLWIDYTATFGKEDTMGYSFVPTAANMALIPSIYSGNLPPLMDVHIYDNNAYGFSCDLTVPGSCTYATYVKVDAALKAVGYTGPLVVGEVFYNDLPSAQALARARQDTRRPIQWVTQWPLNRMNGSILPMDFSAYQQTGF